VGVVKRIARLVPQSMEAQMIAILALSLLTLLLALAALEITGRKTALETAQSNHTLQRLQQLYPMLQRVSAEELPSVIDVLSSCHEGYTLTDQPVAGGLASVETDRLRARLAQLLALDEGRLSIGYALLRPDQFSYRKCQPAEIDLPAQGVVISLRLPSGQWFNKEVHPHEWHIREKLGWWLRASAVFAFVGGIAIFFIHRLSRPLNLLTDAAQRFGQGLEVSTLAEQGTTDLRRAIRTFNAMQRQVADEIARRTNTLAAISHDVRTPLTALRIKAEMIDDTQMRHELIADIERMERITASALEFLRGQSRNEPLQRVDLSALLESECVDFEETGRSVTFAGEHNITCTCRPDALARAVRNLIDNAVKYAGTASVSLRREPDCVTISVSDHGPGIPVEQRDAALEPFGRLSPARENQQGGFGLGLAIAKAVAEGHDGALILADNEPTGLVATIRLPAAGLSPAKA
jgi:signal transduction histidine kinase